MLSQITKAEKIFLGLILTVLGLIYFYPQLYHWNSGFSGSAIIHVDEFNYGGRLQRAIDGEESICNSKVLERKNSPCLIPSFADRLLAIPAQVLGLYADQIIPFYRPILVVIAFLVLLLSVPALELPLIPSALILVGTFLLPGAWYFKPGASLFSSLDIFAFNRFSNPLFSLIPTFLSWFFGIKAFLSQDKFKNAILCGLFLGPCFYVSIFYWSHLCLLYFLAFLVFYSKENLKAFLLIVLSSAFVASFYFYQVLFVLMKHPVYPYISWRNGVLINDHGFFLLKTYLYPYLAIAIFLSTLKRYSNLQWVGISLLSGAICYFLPLLTGKELQNFHYKYTLIPMALLSVVAFGHYLFTQYNFRFKNLFIKNQKLIFSSVLIMITGLSLYKIHKFTTHQQRFTSNPIVERYRPAFKWIRTLPADQVFIASDHIMSLIPMATGQRVFRDSAVEFSPSEEILARNLALWKIRYHSDAELLRKNLRPTSIAIPSWIYGMPKDLQVRLEQKNFPTLNLSKQQWLADKIVERFQTYDAQALESALQQFRADYLIVGPLERRAGTLGLELLNLELVQQFGPIEVYRLSP